MNERRIIGLVFITIALAVGIGWTKNLIKLTKCDFKAPYKAEVIHTIGLAPPIGMITGWINVGK